MDLIKIHARKKSQRLSPDEELQLFKAVKTGDISAKEKIFENNIPIAIRAVQKLPYWNKVHSGMNNMDLVSEGMIALLKAIEDYDLSKKVKFGTFAYSVIQLWVRRSIELQNDTIYIATGEQEKLRKLKHIESSMDNPTIIKLAIAADMSVDDVEDLFRIHEIRTVSNGYMSDDNYEYEGDLYE